MNKHGSYMKSSKANFYFHCELSLLEILSQGLSALIQILKRMGLDIIGISTYISRLNLVFFREIGLQKDLLFLYRFHYSISCLT
jgi:hypothetical protein